MSMKFPCLDNKKIIYLNRYFIGITMNCFINKSLYYDIRPTNGTCEVQSLPSCFYTIFLFAVVVARTEYIYYLRWSSRIFCTKLPIHIINADSFAYVIIA